MGQQQQQQWALNGYEGFHTGVFLSCFLLLYFFSFYSYYKHNTTSHLSVAFGLEGGGRCGGLIHGRFLPTETFNIKPRQRFDGSGMQASVVGTLLLCTTIIITGSHTGRTCKRVEWLGSLWSGRGNQPERFTTWIQRLF